VPIGRTPAQQSELPIASGLLDRLQDNTAPFRGGGDAVSRISGKNRSADAA
jgi:hypothetical protein